MGRPPCCDKLDVRRGLWTAEEDAKLLAHISNHGTKNWTSVPQKAGLKRCGKSCRLRWTNYLRPNLKHESFTPEEEELIVTLHATIGSRWSIIAQQLPGRTDNDVKNYWNTKLSKKLFQRGIDPITHRPVTELLRSIGGLQTVRYRGPHDARISSLNRDLRSVFRYNPAPDHIGAAAPNGSDKETAPLQPHLLPDEASWSPAAAAPNPTLVPSAAPSPPLDLKWSDFLVEDAFLPHDQVDDAAGSNPAWKPADGEHKAAKEEGGIGNMGVPSCSSSSFIDEILDRDRTMMSDFWCKFEVFKID